MKGIEMKEKNKEQVENLKEKLMNIPKKDLEEEFYTIYYKLLNLCNIVKGYSRTNAVISALSSNSLHDNLCLFDSTQIIGFSSALEVFATNIESELDNLDNFIHKDIKIQNFNEESLIDEIASWSVADREIYFKNRLLEINKK